MTPLRPFLALKALFRVVGALFKRKPVFVAPEVVRKRMSACYMCPDFDSEGEQCKICSCFVRLKAELATEKCPKHRWP
jgi:hypothetical protein